MLVIVWVRTLEPVLFKERERQLDYATHIEIYVDCRAHPPHQHTHTDMPSSNATQFKNLPLVSHSQWPRSSSSNRQTTAASIFYCCFFCYCYCFCFFVFYFLSARVLSPFVAIILGRSSLPIGSAEHSTLGTHSVLGTLCSLLNALCCWWQAYAPHSVASTVACAARGSSSGFSLCSLLMTFEWF